MKVRCVNNTEYSITWAGDTITMSSLNLGEEYEGEVITIIIGEGEHEKEYEMLKLADGRTFLMEHFE